MSNKVNQEWIAPEGCICTKEAGDNYYCKLHPRTMDSPDPWLEECPVCYCPKWPRVECMICDKFGKVKAKNRISWVSSLTGTEGEMVE